MFWTMIKDPVVWGSLLGIGIIVAMMAYYTYLFMHNSADSTKQQLCNQLKVSLAKASVYCYEAVRQQVQAAQLARRIQAELDEMLLRVGAALSNVAGRL